MSQIFSDLLAMDRLAQSLGCGGLNPRLRDALEAQSRFNSRRAGPPSQIADDEPLPDGVTRFPGADTDKPGLERNTRSRG